MLLSAGLRGQGSKGGGVCTDIKWSEQKNGAMIETVWYPIQDCFAKMMLA
jgi:hypothetical protein